MPINLLLIEDNPGDVLLIRESLRCCDVPVHVTISQDGQAAIELLQEFNPDLILLDLRMPRLDGFQVLEAIGRVSIPIVVFTWGTEGTDKALALGAKEVVKKPSDFAPFQKTVCDIVTRWAARIEKVRDQ
jgi:two-component system response regulator